MDVLTGSISTYVFSFREGTPAYLALLRAPGLLHAGTWQSVHGMIEPGERAYEAAVREVIEETGLTPARFFSTDYVETFYSQHTDAVHLVPAFAAYVEGAPDAAVSDEHTDFAWLTIDEIAGRFVWPSQRQAVRVIHDAIQAWPEVDVGMKDLTALATR